MSFKMIKDTAILVDFLVLISMLFIIRTDLRHLSSNLTIGTQFRQQNYVTNKYQNDLAQVTVGEGGSFISKSGDACHLGYVFVCLFVCLLLYKYLPGYLVGMKILFYHAHLV